MSAGGARSHDGRRADQLHRVARDQELLVGGDDEDAGGRARPPRSRLPRPRRPRVPLLVQVEAQPGQRARRAPADGGRVLADAARERDAVHARPARPCRTRCTSSGGSRRRRRPGRARSLPAASASSSVRMSLLTPEIPISPLCLLSSALTSQGPSSSLRITWSRMAGSRSPLRRAHHEPFEGREPHRGVHRPPAADRRHRAAVAEVAGDEAQRRVVQPAGRGGRPAGRRRSGARCRGTRSGGCRGARRGRRAGRRGRRSAGMVWWNAVSNTATCGTASPSSSRAAR